MTFDEILSVARSLSETEQQSLITALSSCNIIARPQCRKATVCCHFQKNGDIVLIAAAVVITVSARTKGHNASDVRTAAGHLPNIPVHGNSNLHKKELVSAYMQLMAEQKSLDNISAALHINKKTAFDQRHKILRSLKQDEGCSLRLDLKTLSGQSKSSPVKSTFYGTFSIQSADN